MAASLQRSIADLQEARDRERRFVADVSHELRTPLTALVGEASLLQEHLDAMPPEARRMGELLAADTARLRTLVEDLLEVSRLDAGSDATSLTEFDAAALRRGGGRRPLPAGPPGGAGPAAGALGPPPPGADPGQPARQRRSARRRRRGHRGPAARTGGDLVVVVADRGPGVAEGDLERLFERFYKADAARASAGSGLGLAIARSHARALGGDLVARRREGGGLEFVARVPVAEPLPDGEAPATAG